jgi:hypothetical protein
LRGDVGCAELVLKGRKIAGIFGFAFVILDIGDIVPDAGNGAGTEVPRDVLAGRPERQENCSREF